jgi:hypothetical protein
MIKLFSQEQEDARVVKRHLTNSWIASGYNASISKHAE